MALTAFERSNWQSLIGRLRIGEYDRIQGVILVRYSDREYSVRLPGQEAVRVGCFPQYLADVHEQIIALIEKGTCCCCHAKMRRTGDSYCRQCRNIKAAESRARAAWRFAVQGVDCKRQSMNTRNGR